MFNPTTGTFHSAGFIIAPHEANAIVEDLSEEVVPFFVTPRGSCCNWVVVEIKWMLEQERKAIQPHHEEMEIINLGTDEDKKEIKIGALLDATVRKRVIELLREYDDIFAWSYKDMPGLDPDVVEHRLHLYVYCTSVRTSTRVTPFSLVYGTEAVLPVEVEIPSLRVLIEAELSEAEWCQNRYDQLNLFEEKRMTRCVMDIYIKQE